MSYASIVKGAMAAVPSELRADVVFTRRSSAYNSTTNADVVTVTTIAGKAARGEGDPDTYKSLGLIEGSAPSLVFVPDTEGECPTTGDSVVWAGETFIVRAVAPIAPSGLVLAATVVVSK